MQHLSKTRKQLYARLSSKKMRDKIGLFLVEGRKSVADMASFGGFVVECLIAAPSAVGVAREISERIGGNASGSPEVLEATMAEMREISNLSDTPDLVGVCRLPERRPEDEILREPLPAGLYMALDGVQDPGNLGTIIRTAHWMGIRRIFASPDTVDLYNPKVVQSTMGSMAAVEVDYVDLCRLADRNSHLPLAGLQLEGDNIYSTPLPASAIIVMGSEGHGISEALKPMINLPLTIPPVDPAEHPESLNVAIASAITLSCFRNPGLNRS
ncbi:MAG: RNA methyltransferase [Muribaculaceae bacterium]|nr:RNA methyltransferase [Muribaculaceae bacterium]